MPHLSEFTFPKRHENNERGFNLFSHKDLGEASATLSACLDSRSAATALLEKGSRAGNGEAEIEWWALAAQKSPKCVPAVSTAEPAGGHPGTGSQPCCCSLHTHSPTGAYCALQRLYFSPLNICTLLRCFTQQEQNHSEVTPAVAASMWNLCCWQQHQHPTLPGFRFRHQTLTLFSITDKTALQGRIFPALISFMHDARPAKD